MTHALGIDLGGTKVLAGVVNTETGEVLSAAKKRTRAEHGPKDIIERLVEAAHKALDESGKGQRVDRVGIGAAGQIDRAKGVILRAPNLAGMSDVKLAEIVGKELGKSAYLFNDVEAAAAGEASFGAGRGHQDFVVVFVGTGIGGGIYRGGTPYTGATSTAGELGHMVVDVNGRLCGCGGIGHLEAYASRTAIVRTILSGLVAGRKSSLRDIVDQINPNDPGGSGIRSKAIAQAVKENDELTVESLVTAAEFLAAGLTSIINFYNPPRIILGGGLVEAVDVFFETAANRARQEALQVPRGKIEIVRTRLGDNSGIVGAAVLAAAA